MNVQTAPLKPTESEPTLKSAERQESRPAGFWIRFLAYMIDGFVVNFISMPVQILLGIDTFLTAFEASKSGTIHPQGGMDFTSAALSYVISLGILFFYYGWFYKKKGATPGKMIFKLRVVKHSSGENLSYLRTFFRETVGKVISSIIFMIGYIMAGLRSDKRALHDLMFDSQVLKR